jgi:hypothetical protein
MGNLLSESIPPYRGLLITTWKSQIGHATFVMGP